MSLKSKKEVKMAYPEDIYELNENFVITFKDVVKKFDDVIAVNGLSLKIRKGEVFGLLGPNGAGKTTAINIMNGLLKPTKGQIYVDGINLRKDSMKIKEIIGVCPQHAAIYDFLTGKENIELFGRLHGMKKNEVKSRTHNLLSEIDFIKASKRKARGYSGGMLSQLNLLMALINDPEIVFLDEPTVGMDPRARRRIWEFIRTLKEAKKTIILTTHYIEEAEALSDTVAIIDYGELIALGPPKKLLKEHRAKNLEEVFLKITGRRILEGV